MRFWSRKPTIGTMTPSQIRQLVSKKYSEVAQEPSHRYPFRVGKAYAQDLGYSSDRLETLPPSMTETFTGVSATVVDEAAIREGEVVLELGSGAGLDTSLIAARVGLKGKVIGIDLAPEMAKKARENLKRLGVTNVAISQAMAEVLPLKANSVDCVVSNGIFNLSPEKAKIFGEIHKVLKPGGRLVCAEIVLRRNPTDEERQNADDWFT
ncbi:MAG: methyltransferase domain-containing protein [Candidatus Tectomicrobia bacterium]|nr:methyltransferase domain-containing protein [Candidatus Tectomicrobia bacterium]